MNKPAIGIALASALLAVVAVYAGIRVYDVLFMVQPNPAVVSPSVKIAMFWRLWIGVYLAPLVAIGVHEIARRDLARASRLLWASTIATAALIGFQGLFLP